MNSSNQKIQVWDAPTRLFHWLTAALVVAAYVTWRLDWMDWHAKAGYALLALVIFRLLWGVVGSDTARFSRFVASPRLAIHHLQHALRREPDHQVGHNPAGAWMVLLFARAPSRRNAGRRTLRRQRCRRPGTAHRTRARADRQRDHGAALNYLGRTAGGHRSAHRSDRDLRNRQAARFVDADDHRTKVTAARRAAPPHRQSRAREPSPRRQRARRRRPRQRTVRADQPGPGDQLFGGIT